jgi:signal transduction histidine kinase
LLDAAFPLCSLALFSSLLLLLGVRDHRALRPLAAVFALAFGIMVVPDSVLYYQSLQDTYPPQGVLDLVWPLGCMLIGLGVYSTPWLTLPSPLSGRAAEVEGNLPAFWQACLPYLALPTVAVLLVITRNDRVNSALTNGVYIGACALVVLVVVRQVMVLRESLYRARSLERLNLELRALTSANDELNKALLRQAQADVSRLADLDRLRNDFIAAVSHDLQTPLTSIRAGLVMLDASVGAVLAPDERDLFSAIRRNVDRLRLRVNALLTANQLDAGGLLLDTVCLDLREIVGSAATIVQPLFQEKGQTLDLDLPQPLHARGDAHRLEEIIVNLLANAHRHTPAGTLVVVTGRMCGADVQLDISDDGPGIPTEELEAIFARFHRRARGSGGSGLGLSIARSLVDLHGGRLWAESCVGVGTTFHLSLPGQLEEVLVPC